MSDNIASITASYYVHVNQSRAKWGLHVQANMLAFMDYTQLSPYECAMGKNNAPNIVPRSTLRDWWKHYLQWGETPFQTDQRPFMKQGSRDSLTGGIGTRILSLIDNDPSLYLDEIQAIIFSETRCRYHLSTIWRYLTRPEIGYSLQVLADKALQKSQYEQMIYRGTLAHLSIGKCGNII